MTHETVVVMDDISAITIAKDTTFALLLEAQRRGHRLLYAEQPDLYLDGSKPRARLRPLEVEDSPGGWFRLGDAEDRALGDIDLVLMRKDPPVDAAYIYTTYLLELAEAEGARVINRPRALRDFNEKLAIARFPELAPPTLVSSDAARLKEFVAAQGRAVLKPLDGMGGRSIFLASRGEPNLNVILETLTDGGTRLAQAQGYLPAISDGDKRILLIDGEPVPYVLARIPTGDDFRGNLARGGRGEGRPLSDGDRAIAERVGPELKAHGIVFAGLDVIGDRMTEINVTSPTCVRELDAQFGINIAGDLFDVIE